MRWLLARVRGWLRPRPPDLTRHDRAIQTLRASSQMSRAVRRTVATGNVVEDLVTGAYKEGRE